MNIDQKSDFQASQTWKEWMLCVDATLENKLTLDGSLVSLETLLSQEQSFEIMQAFLQNENVKQILKKVVIKNIKQHESYEEWLDIYNSLENKAEQKITLLQAYNLMRVFFEKSFKDDEKNLNEIQKKLAVDNEQFPIDYNIWFSWMQAAYIILLL